MIVVSELLLATLAGILVHILVRRCCKRERRLLDERDSDTDIEMVCIGQVKDVFTLTAIQYIGILIWL